jgi:hypothetical protein
MSMRRVATMTCTAALSHVPTLVAQATSHPILVGAHAGSNLSSVSTRPIDLPRAGLQASIHLWGPVSLYPSASMFFEHGPGEGQWEVSALIRFDPTPRSARIPIYFGGGICQLNLDGPGGLEDWYERFPGLQEGPGAMTNDVLFVGLKAALGPYQPFVELRGWDYIERVITVTGGGARPQLYFGVSRRVR